MESKLVVNSRQQHLGNAEALAGMGGGPPPAKPDADSLVPAPPASPFAASAPLDAKDWAAMEMDSETKARALATERRLREILGGAFGDLGAAQARLQEYSLAVSYFHDAERWNASTPGVLRNLGLAAFLSENYSECVRALKLEREKQPLSPELQSMLALALYSTKNYDEAVKAFEPVKDAALNDPRMGYAWAYSLAKANDLQRAFAVLDQLAAKPSSAEAMVMFGRLYAELGDKAKAQSCFDKAKQIDPAAAIPK